MPAVSREGSLRVGYLSNDSLISDLGDKQRRFAEASAELAALRYQVQSDDNAVHVTVNGHGNLLDLRISSGELRRAHSSMLGSKIMSVIHKAREEAGEVNRARLEEVIDGVAAPPAEEDPSNQHPSHRAAGAPTRRRSRPRDDDDEDFSQTSYLR